MTTALLIAFPCWCWLLACGVWYVVGPIVLYALTKKSERDQRDFAAWSKLILFERRFSQ